LTVAVSDTAQSVAIPTALAEMMRWPQLATALMGGLLAIGLQEGHRRLTR
jgi:hypothetical protein